MSEQQYQRLTTAYREFARRVGKSIIFNTSGSGRICAVFGCIEPTEELGLCSTHVQVLRELL